MVIKNRGNLSSSSNLPGKLVQGKDIMFNIANRGYTMKSKIISYVVMAGLLMAAVNAYAFEKVGTTSFQFLKVMSSARSCAMGEAFTAVAGNADAVFFNPAGLTRVQNLDASVDYLDWFLDITHIAFAGAYRVPAVGTFGVQIIATDLGEIKETSVEALGFVDGVYLGYTGNTIKPGDQVFGLSFARELTDKFSFGMTAKYAREDLGVQSTGNIIFDGGLIYHTGFRSLELAASVRHFGPEVRFYDEIELPRTSPANDSTYYQKYTGKSYPLPQTFNIGIAAYLISPGESLFLHTSNQTLLVAFDMVQPRDYDQQYNIGMEYGFAGMFFIRAGYKVNYDTESFSTGFGLAINHIRFDYAYSDFGNYLDAVHRFSFGFSF